MNRINQGIDVDLPEYAGMIKQSLSTESLGIVSKIPEFFTKRLAMFKGFFDGSNTDLKSYSTKEMNVYFKELMKNRVKLIKHKGDIDYGVVKRRLVAIFPGFDYIKADIYRLSMVLADANKLVNADLAGVIDETRETMAKLVSDKDYRLSSRPVTFNKKYTADLEELRKLLSEVINPKQVKDTAKVGEIANSIPHIEQAIETVLEYSGKNTTDALDRLQKDVASITNYTDALYDSFVNDVDAIKRQRIVEVAEYLKASADYITQATNVLYLTNQSVVVLNNLVTTVTK